jgi:hypothetical protein
MIDGGMFASEFFEKLSVCPRLEGAIDVVLRVLCGEALMHDHSEELAWTSL